MISSVMPSAKYSSLASGLKLAKGRTATLCVSSVGCAGVNAGGMKVFDRAHGQLAARVTHREIHPPEPAVVVFGFACAFNAAST